MVRAFSTCQRDTCTMDSSDTTKNVVSDHYAMPMEIVTRDSSTTDSNMERENCYRITEWYTTDSGKIRKWMDLVF